MSDDQSLYYLQLSDKFDKEFLHIEKDDMIWLRPTTVKEYLTAFNKYPESRIISGNTDVGK